MNKHVHGSNKIYPLGPEHEIFRSPFFETVVKALRDGGVMCIQAESLWFPSLNLPQLIHTFRNIFKGSVNYAWTPVPAYPRYLYTYIVRSSLLADVCTVHEFHLVKFAKLYALLTHVVGLCPVLQTYINERISRSLDCNLILLVPSFLHFFECFQQQNLC